MQRRRIYQVAKDFNISSEALLEMIRAAGVDAKSHMSAVDDEVIAQIRKKFDAEKEAVKEEEARKHKIQEDTRRVAPVHPHRPPQPGGGGGGGGGSLARPISNLQARIMGKKKKRIDEKAVLESVKKTLADLELGKKKKRKKRIRATGEVAEENPHLLRVSEFIAVAELAALMDVSPSQVIGKALAGGLMVTINQRLEKDTVVLLADDFGYQVEFLTDAEEILDDEDEGEEEAVETQRRRAGAARADRHGHGARRDRLALESTEISSAKVCGASECREVSDPEAATALAVGPTPRGTDDPVRGLPWYTSTLTIPAEERGEVVRVSVTVVPSAGLLRVGDGVWVNLPSESKEAYAKLTAGLTPRPAKTLPSVGEVVEAPSAATPAPASDGSNVWVVALGGGVLAALMAGLLLRIRHRRASTPPAAPEAPGAA